MDFLTFISNIIDSIAWPTSVIVLAFLFQSPLSKILESLTNLKYKDLSVNFKNELNDIEETADQDNSLEQNTTSENNSNIEVTKTREEEIEQVAFISPQAAIPLAWSSVEQALLKAVNKPFNISRLSGEK